MTVLESRAARTSEVRWGLKIKLEIRAREWQECA